jgi:hypothetical protein
MKTTKNIHPVDPIEESHATPATCCRTGKIARLPLAIREQLNQRMLDGEPGKSLVEWLNSLPEVQSIMATQFDGFAVREQNLSEWRKGGHQTWRKEKVERQELASFLEKIDGLKKVAQDGLTDQLAFLLSVRAAFELQRLESAPEGEEKSKAMRQLTARLVALRRGDLEVERLRLQQERYGLHKKTEQERKDEFWKWAEENINRDEFCRRRCYTAAEREAAIDKILGITPADRGETVPEAAPPASCPCALAPASIQANPI